jgi:hydrogenase expression/formation protein HypE
VVPRGKADRIFINTAGLGSFPADRARPAGKPRVGDVIIVTGPLGDHGAAVLSCRKGLNLASTIESDCAPLTDVAQTVLSQAKRVTFMRDLTRGGLATVLNESTGDGLPGILLQEAQIPLRAPVRALCELLGVDPLYMACEGRLGAFVDNESATAVLEALRVTPGAEESCIVGEVTDQYPGKVVVQTQLGTRRLIQMLSGEQLPRIC